MPDSHPFRFRSPNAAVCSFEENRAARKILESGAFERVIYDPRRNIGMVSTE